MDNSLNNLPIDETLTKVIRIINEIKTLEKELDDIRATCAHSEYAVKYFVVRPGSKELVRICNSCQKNIGYPNQEELDNFLNDKKL